MKSDLFLIKHLSDNNPSFFFVDRWSAVLKDHIQFVDRCLTEQDKKHYLDDLDKHERGFLLDVAIRGNHNNPQLTIHKHDITQGWHPDAPKADLIFLDPPYWKQATGRYSQEPGELAEMELHQFNAAWLELVKTCKANLKKNGKIALIISPTEDKDAGVVIDHAFEMDLQLFASLGWLNGRLLDMFVGEDSDSEPLA